MSISNMTPTTTTKREKQKLLSSLYSLVHDLIGGLLLAGLIVTLAFLFSVK